MKKMKNIFIVIFSVFWLSAQSQVVIGTTGGGAADSSAILDVRSTTKGFLIPRMDQSHIDAIKNPAEGLMIYNTTTGQVHIREPNGVLKLGSAGIEYNNESLFKKTAQIDNMDDEANAVCATSDGGYLLVGETRININNSITSAAVFIKFTSGGKPDKNFGTNGITIVSGSSNDIIKAVTQTFDGGYVAAGYSSSVSPTSFCIIKLKSDGTLDNSFGTNGIVTIERSYSSYAYDVKQAHDSGYIVVGYTYNSSNHRDLFAAKLTKNGALDQNFNSGGTLTIGVAADNEYAYSVAVTGNDEYFITGYTNNGNNGGNDIIVIKLNSDGSFNAPFNGGKLVLGSNYSEKGYAVTTFGNGGCFLTGEYQYGLFFATLSGDVSRMGSKVYQNSNYWFTPLSAENISDTLFVVAGYAMRKSDYLTEAFIMELDSNLNFVSGFGNGGVVTFSVRDENRFRSVCRTSDNGFVAAGYTQTSGSDRDILLIKVNGVGKSCGSSSYFPMTYLPFGQTNTYWPATGSGGTTGTFSVNVTSQGTLTTICE